MHKAGSKQVGFTIVELLVVIVVIGILAAITVVSYTGISQKAIVASIQSDLSNNSTILKIYNSEFGFYPASPLDSNNCPVNPVGNTKYCLKFSSGNTYVYSSSSPYSSFSLVATGANGTSYQITDSSSPVAYSIAPIVVTGGTVTTDGAYTIRTFTSNGTLAISGGALTDAQVIVVGGGGGGGGYGYGGGGGAGQVISSTQTLSGSINVTVGNGGNAVNGSSSVLGTITAIGGGTGGAGAAGQSGASGGGGGSWGAGGTGTAGYNGGTGGGWCAGGGGGAGGLGGTTVSCPSDVGSLGGTGGIGVNSSITGVAVGYGGGGGGASTRGTSGGGASYGGGAGGVNAPIRFCSVGAPNTGGGGGGSGRPENSGCVGGSGIVIIRYLTP